MTLAHAARDRRVAQDEPRIEVYRREGETWVLREYAASATVELASIDATLPVDTIYHDPLDAPQADPQPG